MQKRILCLLLSVVTALTLATACSKSTNSGSSNKPVTIHIFMGSPEITAAVNTSIKEYKKVKPNVTIQLQVLQADLNMVLKSMIAADEIPDAFQTTNGPELKEYASYSEDLTNTPAGKSLLPTIAKSMSYNGKVVGLPLKIDEFGIIYNKTIFADAGITELPKTLSALEADCKVLQAKGYTPFGNGYKEWWVYKHELQSFEAASNTNVGDLVGQFIAGTTTFQDHPVMMNYFKFIDVTVQYGLPKPLEIDYNGEISAMGGGKVAMITGQGTWAEANILAIDPKIQIGIMPYPVSEDPTQLNMVAGAGQCLEISKSSKVLTETEDYYNWLFTSDYGINTWFPKVAQLIAPTKTSVSPSGVTLPTQFTALCNDQKIPIDDSAINYSDDGFHTKLGEIMQGYIGKSESETNCITDIQKAWVSLGAPKG